MDTQTISDIMFTGADYRRIADEIYCRELILSVLSKIGCWVSVKSVDEYSVNRYYYYNYDNRILVGDCTKDFFPDDCWWSFYGKYITVKTDRNVIREIFCNDKTNPMVDFESNLTRGRLQKGWISCEDGGVRLSDSYFGHYSDTDKGILKIPTIPMDNDAFRAELLCGSLRFDSADAELSKKLDEAYRTLSGTELFERLAALFEVKTDREAAEKKAKTEKYFLSGNRFTDFVDGILSCDERRADIERYDARCLEDVNLGHWELWQLPPDNEDFAVATLERPLVARDPAADIRSDGIVGIDFGTKSTIVSYQNGSDNTRLLRIGMGQLSKKAERRHYENPTVMEFIDIDSFLMRYNSSDGRPHTSIEDLTVSHKAANSLKNCEDSGFFYSFFYDIKQWCGDSGKYRQVKIVDQRDKERVLPPYLEIGEGEFDPVEIYAYYLGLFINNMRNGIYLDYMLSFPVAYSKAVRERLLKSFTVGLKKSLPESVVADKDIMSRFKVRQGVSEPAAYAICALKGYGFQPVDDEKVFYGIFDFGGGTTDFDFGVWRAAEDTREERRFDFVINHFGAGGDRYLGGENLLELLAFEVFKANRDKLLKSESSPVGYSFYKPPEEEEFAGSEVLISNSQEAKRNVKQLMEKLRPFWEGITSYSLSREESREDFRALSDSKDFWAECGDYLYKCCRCLYADETDTFYERWGKLNDTDTRSIIDKAVNSGMSVSSDGGQIALSPAGKRSERQIMRLVMVYLAENTPKPFTYENYLCLRDGGLWGEEETPTEEVCRYELDPSCKLLDEGFVSVELFDKRGALNTIRLDIINKAAGINLDLFGILEERIDMGVKNFMEALKATFAEGNVPDIDTVNIFLAGNSSKSPVLRRCFERRIKALGSDIADRTGKRLRYVLFPPLGTKEAVELQRRRGISVDESDILIPTGKTGVAYGLLDGRAGGPIKVVSEISAADEIKFRYYLGRGRRGKFFVVADRNKPYNEWFEFIDAGAEDFELYYSTLPEVSAQSTDLSKVYKKRLTIDKTSDTGSVYIRVIEPTVIEYAAANSIEDLKAGKYISAPQQVDLAVRG